MTAVVRNVKKNQIVAEDIALGVGKVNQTRRGVAVEGSRVDIPVPVFSVQEIMEFSPLVSTRLVLEVAPDNYVYYIYRENETEGVPAIGGGVWVPQNLKSDIKLVDEVSDVFTLDGSNHNNFVTASSPTGAVITIGLAERDLGYGVVPAVPSLIFVSANTEGNVELVGDTGVTLITPATLSLTVKGSTVGLIATAVDTWIVMGDLKVV